MKKWFFLFIVLCGIGGGWFLMRTYWRITPIWNQPKFGKVTRGDIRVPITAAGLIEPKRRIQIKSKASGEVIEVKVIEGSRVRVGDVLALLKRDDEERSVVRTRAGLDRAKALREQARVRIEQAKAAVLTAQSRIDEFEASGANLKIDWDKELDNLKNGFGSEQAERNVRTRYNVNQAQLRGFRAQHTSAISGITEAEESVKVQAASVAEAEQLLKDAEQRLSETTIRAPADGLVTAVNVREGMLVKSGTQALGVGTPIMTIADDSELMVITRVDEADYGRVMAVSPIDAMPEIEALREAARANAEQMEKRSGKVRLTVDAFPDDRFDGMITRVEPQGKLNTGAAIIQYDVHVRVTDEQRFKLPLGTQAQVEFTVESVSDALLVPAEAVKSFEGRKGIYVKPDNGDANKPRFLAARFGITDGTVTQVIELLGGAKLDVGQDVYTKLPKVPDEEDNK